jgi:hypothetical protein
MSVILAADAPWSGAAAIPDHRPRLGDGTKTLVHDGVAMAGRVAPPPERRRERQGSPPAIEPEAESETVFAASLIASTLPPPPPSAQNPLRRVGENAAPEQAEGQLRDLLA